MTNPASPPPPPPSTVPPPPGGMPGWLKILLVVLLVLILGCGCGFAACTFMCHRTAESLGSAIKEAADKEGFAVDTSGTGLSLPASFPADVPVYSGFKVVSRIAPPDSKGGSVAFTGSGSPADVGTFYDKQLTDKGWKQVMANTQGDSVTEAYTKDDQTVSITAVNSGGKTTLTITYGKK